MIVVRATLERVERLLREAHDRIPEDQLGARDFKARLRDVLLCGLLAEPQTDAEAIDMAIAANREAGLPAEGESRKSEGLPHAKVEPVWKVKGTLTTDDDGNPKFTRGGGR